MKPPSRLLPLLLGLAVLTSIPAVPQPSAPEGTPPPSFPAHTPIYSITAGRSVPVSVSFEDPGDITEMRLYFKTMAAAGYLFLEMAETGRGTWTANLPPARNWTKGIDYLLLRKSPDGEVRKSKPLRLLVMDDFASRPPAGGEMEVQTEDASAARENDFAVPLRVAVTTDPLLARAEEDPYPPIEVPGPGRGSSGIFGGLGGFSFSLKVGGVSFRYGSFSGR